MKVFRPLCRIVPRQTPWPGHAKPPDPETHCTHRVRRELNQRWQAHPKPAKRPNKALVVLLTRGFVCPPISRLKPDMTRPVPENHFLSVGENRPKNVSPPCVGLNARRVPDSSPRPPPGAPTGPARKRFLQRPSLPRGHRARHRHRVKQAGHLDASATAGHVHRVTQDLRAPRPAHENQDAPSLTCSPSARSWPANRDDAKPGPRDTFRDRRTWAVAAWPASGAPRLRRTMHARLLQYPTVSSLAFVRLARVSFEVERLVWVPPSDASGESAWAGLGR